ncbi:hypothetical protein [Loigolactobacillus jiayinensis]|uniref:Uncharacterized protein n=1 Tax=Loigolactobacillus jiayinensis TaxID=2486016 RepID=A0ABW1RH07_9LACO|nr:hypothetical protein [Loigolactobacillus jiayinensis]
MKQIAGTIMLIDETGAPKFLVTKSATHYHLLLTDQTTRTPLATILAAFKEQLGIDITALRLSELSNVVIRDQDISLFVFEWGALTKQQLADNMTALQLHGYSFEHPKKLKRLLAQIDMSGVPHFN